MIDHQAPEAAPEGDDSMPWEPMRDVLKALRDRDQLGAFFEWAGYAKLNPDMWAALNATQQADLHAIASDVLQEAAANV